MVEDIEFMDFILTNPDRLKTYSLLPEITSLLLKLTEKDFEKARRGHEFIEGIINAK